MSGTLGDSEARIRDLTGDDDPSEYAIGTWQMWRLIEVQTQEVGARAGMAQSWTSPAFSTADGTADYALPTTSSAEYAQIVMLKDVTHGTLITKADSATIERYRESGGTTFGKGFPDRFSLMEGTTQIVTVRLYPVPNGVYAIDALKSLLPTRYTASTDAIPFATDLLFAMELRTAARAYRLMTPAQRESRLLNEGVVTDWLTDSESLVKEGIRRMVQLKRQAGMERVHG